MDQQAMGEIGVQLGTGRYITFSREENTFATFVKCFNKYKMLQINNSRKLKWNLNALIKNNKFKNLENLTKDVN
jgi:hypothetical protein